MRVQGYQTARDAARLAADFAAARRRRMALAEAGDFDAYLAAHGEHLAISRDLLTFTPAMAGRAILSHRLQEARA